MQKYSFPHRKEYYKGSLIRLISNQRQMISSINKKKSTGFHHKKRIDEPVTSYGITLFYRGYFTESTTGEIYFLLQQRRDTFEYMDFIRGMWRTLYQAIALFTLMSIEERQRIRDFIFQELWDDLFVDKQSKMYKESYAKAKRKYDSIRHLIPHILDTTQTNVIEPPWGFPKGKKNSYHESEIDCAIRETEEETKIPASFIKTYPHCKYSEQFSGTNGKVYATHYYLAETLVKHDIGKMETLDCIRKDTISEESRAVKWVTYEEASKYLNLRQQQILHEALDHIKAL